MRKALIDRTGIVVNVIEIADDSDWQLPEGHKLVASDTAGTGDTYRNREFTRPTSVPKVVRAVKDTDFTKAERRAIRERFGLEG